MSLVSVEVKHRSNTYTLSFDPSDWVEAIFDCIGEVVDLESNHCVLVIHGKKYAPGSSDGIPIGDLPKSKMAKNDSGGKISALLLSVSASEVEKMKRFKPDPLLKGMAQEARDEQRRIEKTLQLLDENPWGEKIVQDTEYRFNLIEVLFRRTDPSPYDAEKLLKKLSIDPGIVHVMKTRRFAVGCLCEIDPLDTDVEQAAKGEGDKCLLGWNRNFGQRIALRLRTDDLKSFRHYDSIVNTLIHELTHNVHGPHDDQFWRLFNELKGEYSKVHRARSTTSTRWPPVQNQPKRENPASGAISSKIGGNNAVPSNATELRLARLKALDKLNLSNSSNKP